MIVGRHITLEVRGKNLLHDVSLQVEPGAFTAIAGPNGAGKSSLLKILSHETVRYTGDVEVNGDPIRQYDIGGLSRVRAVLPQSSYIQFPFSVSQIVMLGTQYHRKTRHQNEMIAGEVMELTGVSPWRNRNYLTLSGGEQQRVNLARVLAQVWEIKTYSRYILLDEPTSNLDIAQQQMIFSLVKRACERNIGVLAIVHDLNQVAQFADKIYFLREGRMVASGTTEEVFTKKIIEETFCCRVNVYRDPCTDCPYIVPDKSENTFRIPTLKTLKL